MSNSIEANTIEETVKAYEIGCCKELGKFLIAKRNFEPGDIILQDTPLIHGPKTGNNLICVGCCKILTEESKFCLGCGWPVCSTECEKLETMHSVECQILKLCPVKQSETCFRYDILLILRGLLLPIISKDKWGVLLNLEDELNDRYLNSDFLKKTQEKSSFVQEVYIKPVRIHEHETGSVILPKMPNYIVKKLAGVLITNTIEFNDSVQIIYPTVSLLEQNCLPNTTYTVDPKNNYSITIRSLMPIKKGEHLTISYANLLCGTQERKEYLKKLKHITCSCARCLDPTELDTFFSAMICFGSEEEPCKGTQLPLIPTENNSIWICNKCDIKLPNKEVLKFVQHLSKEVDKELNTKPTVEGLKEFLGKLELFLHPNHYLIHRIKCQLAKTYSDEDSESLIEKVKLCDDLIDVVKKIDPISVRLGVHLYPLLKQQFKGKSACLFQTYSDENKEASIGTIKGIVANLKRSKEIALFQNKVGNGDILLDEVNANEVAFFKWLEDHSVILEEL